MTGWQSLTRREFLLETAGGAALVAGSMVPLPPAAPDAAQGKPPLTVRSVNDYIAGAEREDESTRFLLAAEVKRNVVTFLDQRFALSEAQRHALQGLSDEERRRIGTAVELALRPGHHLLIRGASTPIADSLAERPRSTSATVTLTTPADSTASGLGTPNGDVILSWRCPAVHGR